jgi:hypothetical protein
MFQLDLQAGPHPAHRECHQAPKAWEHFCVPWPKIAEIVETLQSTVGGVVGVAPAAVSRRGVWRVGRGCRIGKLIPATNELPTTPNGRSNCGRRQGDGLTAFCFEPCSTSPKPGDS